MMDDIKLASHSISEFFFTAQKNNERFATYRKRIDLHTASLVSYTCKLYVALNLLLITFYEQSISLAGC